MSKCTRIINNSVAVLVAAGTHYSIRCYDTQLTVLLGECHINGYLVTPTTAPLNICSLDSQSRLALNSRHSSSLSAEEITESLKNTQFSEECLQNTGVSEECLQNTGVGEECLQNTGVGEECLQNTSIGEECLQNKGASEECLQSMSVGEECIPNTSVCDDNVSVGAVILVQPAENTTTALLRSTYKRLWDADAQERPLVKLDYFELYSGLNRALQIDSDWAGAVDSLVANTLLECRVAICGPKNAGKSTLCRYTINTLLGAHRKVLFLETDIGQSELTPSSLLTLSVIREPLLNPPFANKPTFVKSLNLKHGHCKSESYCIGTVSPGQVMAEYMEKARILIKKGRKLCREDAPLVVNNMGWTKGFGVGLHADIMRLLEPTHIINLQTYTSKDLPPIPELLETPGILPYEYADGETVKNIPKILDLPSYTSPTKSIVTFQAFELRHMALLNYFSPVYSATNGGVVAPYKVSWKHVAVILPDDVEHELAAYTLNCSVVALLTALPIAMPEDDSIKIVTEEDSMKCLGLGIIRAVDVNDKVFYINTPVDPGILEQVFVLKHTSLPVPHVPSGSLPVPYLNNLSASEIMGVGSRSQRANLKRRYHAIS